MSICVTPSCSPDGESLGKSELCGEGGFREEPSQSPAGRGMLSGRTLSVAYGDSSPEGRALGKEGRSRPHLSTAGRSQPISGKLSALAKASPFRERWHGEAVTERVASRTNPLSLAALDSSPEGRAIGKEGRSRPHLSTAGRSQPISEELPALAKASPFRERWHGEAVTERVSPRLAAAFGECFPNRSRGKIGKSVCAKENIPSDAFCPAERPTAET